MGSMASGDSARAGALIPPSFGSPLDDFIGRWFLHRDQKEQHPVLKLSFPQAQYAVQAFGPSQDFLGFS